MYVSDSMRKRTFLLVFIIAVLFALLAYQLKYIEDSLLSATTSSEERCNSICLEEGKTGFIKNGFCHCRLPVKLSKRWTCFWNITPNVEKSITFSPVYIEHSKRIPVYPSEIFKDKIDPMSVRNLAVSSVSKFRSPNSAATKIFGIYSFVSKSISYVSDPLGGEYIAWPNETIESGGGDCDDYAILLASMYQSVGLKPTIVQVYNREYGHVFIIVPVSETLEEFMKKYRELLQENTDMHGELPFNFMVFGTSKEHCEGINRNLAEGGDLNSFNIIIDGTSRDYAGSVNPVEGYEFIRFIPL